MYFVRHQIGLKIYSFFFSPSTNRNQQRNTKQNKENGFVVATRFGVWCAQTGRPRSVNLEWLCHKAIRLRRGRKSGILLWWEETLSASKWISHLVHFCPFLEHFVRGPLICTLSCLAVGLHGAEQWVGGVRVKGGWRDGPFQCQFTAIPAVKKEREKKWEHFPFSSSDLLV